MIGCGLNWIKEAPPVIPPKANRKRKIDCDLAMCFWRHLADNFFCNLKEFRRIATRYDKTRLRLRRDDHPRQFTHRDAMNVYRP
jgi:hypothetical protein